MNRTASSRPALLFAGPFVALTLVGCAPESEAPAPTNDGATQSSASPVEEADDAAPSTSSNETPSEVALRTVDKAEFDETLAGLKGKVVLVDCWATWCGPCIEQFPHTVAKANELADKGFAAVSLSFDDPEDPEAILEFLRDQKAGAVTNLVSAHGASPESMEAFDLGGPVPWYQLYDRQGELRYSFTDQPEPGVDVLPVAEIDAKIDELLAQPQEP